MGAEGVLLPLKERSGITKSREYLELTVIDVQGKEGAKAAKHRS